MSQTFKKQGHCECCNTAVLAERQSGMSDGMGCLLVIVTAGLFLPIYLLARIAGEFRPFLCPRCGSPIKTASPLPGMIAVFVVILVLAILWTIYA